MKVAKNLFKLMAFKDEYEVARLMTQTGFGEKLAQEFEGDFKVNYHLAPPFLAKGRDSRGRPGKRSFGPWMGRAMGMLAGMRRLRSGPFDPFRFTEDGRLHRELLAWYRGLLERAATGYTGNDAWDEALDLPSEIRGYGPVRAKAARAAMARYGVLASGL